MKDECKEWYNNSYNNKNASAFRMYPNEELCRFIGRSFNKFHRKDKENIKILEVGCGNGSNLWMLGEEGFDFYGIDLSEEGIQLGKEMLKRHQILDSYVKENGEVLERLSVQNMTKTNFESEYFDIVIDIFSSYCLDECSFNTYLKEMNRILKKKGILFSYTPSKASDTFTNYQPSIKIDESTLEGIRRNDAPYYGNFYPFRFMNLEDINNSLQENGFNIGYVETVSRTYRSGKEYFEHFVYEGIKI